jgi:hypothetical protein
MPGQMAVTHSAPSSVPPRSSSHQVPSRRVGDSPRSRGAVRVLRAERGRHRALAALRPALSPDAERHVWWLAREVEVVVGGPLEDGGHEVAALHEIGVGVGVEGGGHGGDAVGVEGLAGGPVPPVVDGGLEGL